MPLKNTANEWGSISKALHWLVVALILAMAWIGLTMGDLPNGPDKIATYALHKSIGISILALVVLRLGWRLYAGAPHAVAGTPGWQERIASATHWLLYVMMFAIPLSGWLYDSASGLRPFKLFGLVEMPKLVAPSEQASQFSHAIHEWGFWALILLVLAHAAAAFYHHIHLRDATLARMLPQGWLNLPQKDSA